jgi:peptidyl-prolyl cis-trans isomerase A (cyclophilin A)
MLLATASGTIAGTAFIDSNHNGTLDPTETKTQGIVITLSGNTTQGTPISVKATTNASGGYTFQNVLPGTYKVSIDAGQVIVLGSASTVSNLIITTNQSLTANLGGSALVPVKITQPARISMRNFLTTSSPASSALPPPGSGTGLANYRPNNAPTVKTQIANVSVAKNASPTVIDVAANFTDADYANTNVVLNTIAGPINIRLFDASAPQTVANFLDYVNSGAYTNDIFHRLAFNGSTPFVLQGGGFTFEANPSRLTAVTTLPPVQNEFGASNVLGTVAMAKLGNDPNSATSQFFFNLGNNSANLDNQNGGFTVFAKVASAADQAVINKLAAFPRRDESAVNGAFTDLPLQNYNGTNFPTDTVASNYALINSAAITNQDEVLKYKVLSNTNPGLVTPTFNNERLTLTYAAGASGTSTITVQATDRYGATVTSTFTVTVT